MSWIVKNLILDSSEIRTMLNKESDMYLLLLSLETKILDLCSKKIFSSDDVEFLILMSNYKKASVVAKMLDINYATVVNRLRKLSETLSFYLGDEYTDYGYVAYLTQKHRLTEEQVNKLINKIVVSKYN